MMRGVRTGWIVERFWNVKKARDLAGKKPCGSRLKRELKIFTCRKK